MFGANEIVGKRFFDKEGKLFVTSMFMTLQGEGPFAGQPAFFIRLAKCNLNCHFCFVGNTLINMAANGPQIHIKYLQVGDNVQSWCEKTMNFVQKRVTEVHASKATELTRLQFESDSDPAVFSTPDHLYYVWDEGWLQAQEIKPGMSLFRAPVRTTDAVCPIRHRSVVSATKTFDKRSGILWARLGGANGKPVDVYNLTVEDTPTYVANNMVVHNCDTYFDDGDWMTFDEIDAKIDEVINDAYKGNPPDWAKERDMVLVMTGGEPMLQKEIVPFLHEQRTKFKDVQIESNGILPQDLPDDTLLVISPKCSEKTLRYLKPHKDNLKRANCLKFVLEATGEYSEIPKWAHEWHLATSKPIFISPMNVYNEDTANSKSYHSTNPDKTLAGRSKTDEVVSFWEEGLLDREANQRNHEYAAQYCLKHGYTLNLQMHLYASLA